MVTLTCTHCPTQQVALKGSLGWHRCPRNKARMTAMLPPKEDTSTMPKPKVNRPTTAKAKARPPRPSKTAAEVFPELAHITDGLDAMVKHNPDIFV